MGLMRIVERLIAALIVNVAACSERPEQDSSIDSTLCECQYDRFVECDFLSIDISSRDYVRDCEESIEEASLISTSCEQGTIDRVQCTIEVAEDACAEAELAKCDMFVDQGCAEN